MNARSGCGCGPLRVDVGAQSLTSSGTQVCSLRGHAWQSDGYPGTELFGPYRPSDDGHRNLHVANATTTGEAGCGA
jgi:hypothetical protein